MVEQIWANLWLAYHTAPRIVFESPVLGLITLIYHITRDLVDVQTLLIQHSHIYIQIVIMSHQQTAFYTFLMVDRTWEIAKHTMAQIFLTNDRM